MGRKVTVTSHTKNVNKNVEDGIVKNMFVKLAENGIILTKNLCGDLYERYSKMISKKLT